MHYELCRLSEGKEELMGCIKYDSSKKEIIYDEPLQFLKNEFEEFGIFFDGKTYFPKDDQKEFFDMIQKFTFNMYTVIHIVED